MSERERKVWWHRGSDNMLRQGRAWLHVHDSVLSVEWALGGTSFSIGLDLDADDRKLSWRFVVPGVGLYFGVESWHVLGPLFDALGMGYDKPHGGGRSFGLRIYDWTVSWECWARQHEWRSSDPRWMNSHVNLAAVVLGERHYTEEELETRSVLVPMPEGTYPAVAKVKRATWKRPRWPKALVRVRCDIDIADGIPIPGKGENSWDCGPDATYSLSCVANSIEDGIGELVASTLRTRQKRAGTHVYTERSEPAPPAPPTPEPVGAAS